MYAPVYCRVTVLTPGRRVDVALPADVPLAELVPLVLELFGEPGPAARPDPWTFTGASGGSLPPDTTLGELGVLDGELLRLGPDVPPPPPPVFDDPVDALATLAIQGVGPDRRRSVAVAVLGVAVAAAVLLATRREDDGTAAAWDAVAVGGLGAVLALLWAAGRRRTASSAGDRLAALLPVYCAVPLAAAAGWAALPGPPGAVNALLAAVAAGAAAALGQVAVRVAAPAPIAALVITMSVMTAAVVNLWFVVPIPTVAALTGAVAVSAGPLLPRVALRLARLPRPVVPADAPGLIAADDGPDLLPHDELAERAALARSHLAGLSGGCALTAAVAAPLGAAMSGWAGPALAVVIVTVLILRARGFADPAVAGVQLASGTTAGLALVGVVAAANNGVNRLLCALVLLGAAATGTAALGRDGRGGSPVARRAVDISEGVLTAAAVPLALAAAGVFAVLRAR